MSTSKTKWQTCEPKVVLRVTNGTIFCIWLTSWIFRHSLAATSFKQKAEFCDVEKIPRRSFGRFADGEGEVKSDESCVVSKLVYCEAEFSKCEWTFRVSDRTDKPSSSFGRPPQGNTGGSLSLRSHEKPEGITSKIGSEHSEWNVSSPSFGRPLRGTRNQESSELPGREHDCSSSFGRPSRGTRTQENRTNPELCNMEVTTTEYKKKVFSKLAE